MEIKGHRTLRAITATYVLATNTKPSRIRVLCGGKSKFYQYNCESLCPYDYAVSEFLMDRIKEAGGFWDGTWIKGDIPGGYVYVLAPSKY